MALSQQLAEQLSSAYTSGDIGAVNQLLSANQVGAKDVQSFWSATPEQMSTLASKGVSFYNAPTTGGITTLTNTGGAAGPNTLTGGNAALTSAASTVLPTITLPSNIGTQSANAKASLYNTLLEQGYTDAQIRNAAGTQTDADWNELQRLSKTAPSYSNLINQAYGSIGRTGFGTGTANIDRPGYDYWMSELTKGNLTPDVFRSTFDKAVDDFIAANPTDVYSRQALTTRLPNQFVTSDGKTVDMTSLNKGFEWAEANKFDDAALKNTLGEKTYNDYVTKYGQGIMSTLNPALADGKITGQEALDIVSAAKKYGLDANEISKYTKLNSNISKAFFDTYDKTLTGIVGNALDANSSMTEAQRIGSILALQGKYGVTDSDIAKYSDGKVTKEAVTGYLDPLRNFSSDFEKTLSTPDLTYKQLNDFLEGSLSKSAVKAIYGEKLSELDKKYDDIDAKWSRYGVDSYQAQTIYDQINNINKAAADKGLKTWNGDWMSGGDNAAIEAAVRLQKKGVDNLSDLKVTPKFENAEAVEMFNGQPVQTDKDGRKFTTTYNDYTGGAEQTYVPAGAQTQLAYPKVSSYAGESGGEYTEYVPLTADELKTYDAKTGKFDLLTGKNLIDASTGKVISSMPGSTNNFVVDSYSTGNFFKGKDKTFGLMISDSGVPVPYQTTEKTGVVYSPILPILASFLIPGLASTISGMLPGAAVTGTGAVGAGAGIGFAPATAMNTALSNALAGGIVGGSTAALRDGSFGKGFVSGAINPLVNYGVGSLLPTGFDPMLGKVITNTAGNVARAAFTGADVGDAFKGGILSGAADYALNPVFNAMNLTPAQVNLATGIVIPSLLGQDINPINAIKTLGSLAQSTGATK